MPLTINKFIREENDRFSKIGFENTKQSKIDGNKLIFLKCH